MASAWACSDSSGARPLGVQPRDQAGRGVLEAPCEGGGEEQRLKGRLPFVGMCVGPVQEGRPTQPLSGVDRSSTARLTAQYRIQDVHRHRVGEGRHQHACQFAGRRRRIQGRADGPASVVEEIEPRPGRFTFGHVLDRHEHTGLPVGRVVHLEYGHRNRQVLVRSRARRALHGVPQHRLTGAEGFPSELTELRGVEARTHLSEGPPEYPLGGDAAQSAGRCVVATHAQLFVEKEEAERRLCEQGLQHGRV